MRCEQLPVLWVELGESCLNHTPPSPTPCKRKTPALTGYKTEMISSWLYPPHQKQAQFREGNSFPSAMNYVASVIKILIRGVGGRLETLQAMRQGAAWPGLKARTIGTQSSTQVCQASPHSQMSLLSFPKMSTPARRYEGRPYYLWLEVTYDSLWRTQPILLLKKKKFWYMILQNAAVRGMG